MIAKRINDALKWRYEVYLSEYRDMYPNWKTIQKTLRAGLKNCNDIYIYANNRNVGDYISHLGLKMLVGREGPSVLCTPVNRLWYKRVLNKNAKAHYHIGGGGLLQPIFEDFWQKLLSSEARFNCIGIGINIANNRSLINQDLLRKVVEKSDFFSVRDTMSQNIIYDITSTTPPVTVCPSILYLRKNFTRKPPSKKITHIFHPSDLRFSGCDLEKIRTNIRNYCGEYNYRYVESDNLSNDHKDMIDKYLDSDLIISSRLHGCIIAHALGIPFIALSCDKKTQAFLETHSNGSYHIPKYFEDLDYCKKHIMDCFSNERCLNTNIDSQISTLIDTTKHLKQI